MEDLEQLKYPIGRFQRPGNFDAAQVKDAIAVLRVLPSWMDTCIENLDEAQFQIPYRPGGWTIQQVVHHVADSHMNAYMRLKLTLTEDNPTIKTYAEKEWAELPDVQLVPVNISVTLLHALHRRMVAVLENMAETDWQKTFCHPEQKRNVPLWELVALYAWHSKHHTAHIRALRNKMNF